MLRTDLNLFIRFVLLDEALRQVCGRKRDQEMIGFWMAYNRTPGMRDSDALLRRRVCLEALVRFGGERVSDAAAAVAIALGQKTAEEINRIRTSYYEDRPMEHWLRFFESHFYAWKRWAIEASDARVQYFSDQYEQGYGRNRRDQLARLFEDVKLLKTDGPSVRFLGMRKSE